MPHDKSESLPTSPRVLQLGDYNMQYFFTAKVIEVDEEYLLLEVFDVGNTNVKNF